MVKIRLYATTHQGLEKVTAEEIRELGGEIQRTDKGRVYFKGSQELIDKLNYHARTCERIIALLKVTRAAELNKIHKEIKSIDFSFIKSDESFAIKVKRLGVHDFNSMDIARVAGDAVIKSYLSSEKKRLTVNLNSPDIIIRVELIDDLLLVGLDTTGKKGLHRRGYRIYQHPAPLNPTIAASLLKISEWDPSKVLVDPMCGSGTILIEAALMGSGIPPGLIRESGDELPLKRDLRLIGVEKFRKHVEGCKKMLLNLGMDFIEVLKGDAGRLDEYIKKADVIVTNPPYGIRIGKRSIIRRLYHRFLKNSRNVINEDGRIVLLTPQKKLLRRIATELNYKWTETPIIYGDLPVAIFKLRSQ